MADSTRDRPAPFEKRLSTCLGASLEAWAHMILYQRHVYPSETFTTTTFLGVRSYINRHPAVVSYIADTLTVAVPSLMVGATDEMILIIVHQDDEDGSIQELERYVLRFRLRILQPDSESSDIQSMEHIERKLRDLVLSAHALENGRSSAGQNVDDAGVSFRISIRVPEDVNKSCTELNEAFATGTWFAPSYGQNQGNVNTKSDGRVIRPLYQFVDEAVGSILFSMLKKKRIKKDTQSKKEVTD